MTKTASATTQYVFDVHRERRCRTIVAPCRGRRSVDSDALFMIGTVSCYKESDEGAEVLLHDCHGGVTVHCFGEMISFLHDTVRTIST